jgi:hypothetical protein
MSGLMVTVLCIIFTLFIFGMVVYMLVISEEHMHVLLAIGMFLRPVIR